MYSMPSNYCPSPIRLMPACPLVPTSPMTGVQTFYITMPSDAAAAMFFDPNLAAVQQQHQTIMMQHAAHQTSMSPYRHIQQHHQMIVGNNTTDPQGCNIIHIKQHHQHFSWLLQHHQHHLVEHFFNNNLLHLYHFICDHQDKQ